MTYTLPTGNETIAGLYTWASNVTGGVSSTGILLIIFSVAFFGTQRFGARFESSLLVSLFVTELIAGSLMIMGALPSMVVSIGALLVLLAYFYASQNQ